MLVRKKKYNKLKEDYNWLVDIKMIGKILTIKCNQEQLG